MKKDVFINITGVQIVDEQRDTTELYTEGSFYKKNNNYYIVYDESEATGFNDSRTTLKIEGDDRVTMMRSGEFRSHLVVEKDNRNVGHYDTGEGALAIGISTKTIRSNLCDDGGDLFFSYSMDINSSLVSENEIYIKVK